MLGWCIAGVLFLLLVAACFECRRLNQEARETLQQELTWRGRIAVAESAVVKAQIVSDKLRKEVGELTRQTIHYKAQLEKLGTVAKP